MSDGYDYGPGPGYGFGGPPPFAATAPVLFLLLLVILVAAGVAAGLRQGRAMERRRLVEQRDRTAQVIFSAIRQPLNAALLATGERVFAPTRTLIETIDLYLGPIIQLSGAVGPIQNLRKALMTTQKEVEVKPGHGHPQHMSPVNGAHAISGPTYAFAAPQPTIILTTPVAGQPGQASASSAGGASVASASSDTGSGIHVIQPAPMSPMVLAPAGMQPPGAPAGQPAGQVVEPVNHAPPEVRKEKVDLTLKEQARNVREALEALSDYWQEDRIKDHIAKAQAALMIHEKLGTVNEKAAERAGFFAPRARAVRNDGGSMLRPATKPKS